MKKKHILIGLFLLFLAVDLGLAIYYYAFGRGKQTTSTQSQQPAREQLNEFLPNVRIVNLVLDDRPENNQKPITGRFTVQNKEKVSLTGLSFLLQLVKEQEKKSLETIDKQLLDQEVVLKPEEEKIITFAYSLPEYHNDGTYFLLVRAYSQTGLTLTQQGTVLGNLKGKNKFLDINWKDSKLLYGDKEVFPLEGPSFPANSQPQITLTVKNPNSIEVRATPWFVIYQRAPLVGSSPIADYKEKEMIVFEPKSEKKLTLSLPAKGTPDSYLAYLRFVDSENKLVSGLQEFRWVIAGKGAKILAFKVDAVKKLWKTTLTLSTSLVGPPDHSLLKNVQFEARVFTDEKEKKLIATIAKTVNLMSQPTLLALPIQLPDKLSSSLVVEGKIIGPNNQTLDVIEKKLPLVVQTSQINTILPLILILAIVTIILSIFLIRKKRKLPSTLILTLSAFFLIVSIFLWRTSQTLATQIIYNNSEVNCTPANPGSTCYRDPPENTDPTTCGPYCASANGGVPPILFDNDITLSKSEMMVGEIIYVWGSAFFLYDCNNAHSNNNVTVSGGGIAWDSDSFLGGVDIWSINGKATDIGANQTVTVTQKPELLGSQCYPSCSAENIQQALVTIKQQFYYCDNDYSCLSDGPYTNISQCDTAHSFCWSDFDSCAPACKPSAITPTPGQNTYKKCFNGSYCMELIKLGNEQSDCGVDADCYSLKPQHLECVNNACAIVSGGEADAPDCQGKQSGDYCGPEVGSGKQPPPPQTYLRCLGETNAICAEDYGPGPNECGPKNASCIETWTGWTPTNGCGFTTQKRTCDCTGFGSGIACCQSCPPSDGLPADTCWAEQTKPVCFSQGPQRQPDNISVTQPDGGTVIQTRDVIINWQFDEIGDGCNGNNDAWGFNPNNNCASQNVNTFKIKLYNGFNAQDTPFATYTVPSTGGNQNNKPYTLATSTSTTTKPLKNNNDYSLRVCANNGLSTTNNGSPAENCSLPKNFTKYAYPQGQVKGLLYEHPGRNNPPYCEAGIAPGITLQLLADPAAPPVSCDAGFQYLTMQSCIYITSTTQSLTKKTSYDCRFTYDNTNCDIPTADAPFDYLKQKFSLKINTPANFTTYDAFYCENSGVCPKNPSNNELCTNAANPALPALDKEFDRNDGAVGTLITRDVGFDLDILGNMNTGGTTYFKLKNVSFVDVGPNILKSEFPANLQIYDAEDTDEYWFIIGNAVNSDSAVGPVLANGTPNLGTTFDPNNVTKKNWKNYSYTKQTYMNVTTFIDYIKARKSYTAITTNDASEITTSNKIYLKTGDLTLNQNDMGNFNNKNVILAVTGILTLDFTTKKFVPADPGTTSTMLVANTIKFYAGTKFIDDALGIFFANTIDLGDSPDTDDNPLKIKGNLIAVNEIYPLKRNRSAENNLKPTLFVVFDAKPYINLLPLLSTATYNWTELVPQ